MTRYSWQEAVGYSAGALVLLAAFPWLARLLRWRSGRSPRRVVASLVFNTALTFALQAWVHPYLRRMAALREQAEEELRQQLGRRPSEDELFAHLGVGRRR